MPEARPQFDKPAEPATLAALLARLAGETRRGVVFIGASDQEDRVPYARLLADARRMLGRLRAHGLLPGQELVIQTSHNRALLTIFWACVLGGLIPVPLAPARQADNRRKLWGVWPRLARPWLAVDADHWAHLSRHDPDEAATLAGRVMEVETLWSGLGQRPLAPGLVEARPQDLALVQFSSGSTGRPKGVCLTHANLLSNLAGMASAAAMTAADSFIGWMPLTHDMGLIAFHLLPTFLGVDQYILDTAAFIRRPGLWLGAASRHRVTVLGSPTFGLQLLLASLRSGPDPAWDLSGVRILFNAAEPISAKVCDQFTAALAPSGLARAAMYTSYGLAESSVGAAFPEPGREFARVHLDRRALNLGQAVRKLPAGHPEAATFVCEGQPLPGTEIAIHDDGHRPLPDGHLGRIVIRGASVTQGYHRDPEATAQALGPKGWLDTGDLGLMLDGQLVVAGRAKDVIFAHGQNFYSHDLERVAETIPGVGAGKSLAVGLTNLDRETEEVIVFLRHRSRELGGLAALAERVAETIARDLGLSVDHVLPVEEIPRTTSGKLRRYLLRQRYLAGEFSGPAAELAALRAALRQAPATPPAGVPPRLAALWAAVLDISDPPAGASFFALGGDSLRARRLLALVQDELGLPAQAADLFAHPSLTAFAARLAELTSRATPPPSSTAPREHYPATPNQVRLHALQAADPEATAYNLAIAMRLRGGLDASALERALAGLVAAHEPLRTGLEVVAGQVAQRVHPPMALPLGRGAWPAGADPADPARLGQVLRGHIKPFDLARPPLLRATLLDLGPDDHLLLLDAHHAVADGGSLPRLLADLGRLYAGQPVTRDAFQFKDHAVHLGAQAVDRDADRDFWLRHLGPEPPRLELPLAAPRPPWPSRAGRTLFVDLDPALVAALRRLAGELESTPNLVLMAGFAILLARHAGQEDLVLATVSQGRHHPGCRALVGMFVNTLPLRLRPGGDQTLAEFLAQAREALAGALRHQDQPLEELPARLGLARQPGRDPLFDAMFAPEDLDLGDLAWPGLALELLDFDPGTAKFDLTLFARPRGAGYRIWLEYASALFAPEAMAALLRRYRHLLADMARAGASGRLDDLDPLEPTERQRLLVEFNATDQGFPRLTTLDRLISAQAQARPEAVALAEADGGRASLTYAELERAANRAAWRLRERGLGPGGVAAVLATRSCELVAGILAVLKAGAAFLPLEPDLPPERLAWLAADSGATMLLLGPGQTAPPCLPPPVAVLALADLLAAPGREDPPPPLAGPSDLAYVIYTSGSTGRPKGVMIAHRSAVNYLTWAARTYLDGQPGDLPLFTSVAFDLTITSLFVPLISGGRVIIHGDADAADLVGRVAAQDQADVIKLTPAHLAILREDCPPVRRLKALIVGGEDLKTELARDIWQRLDGRVAIYNEYGPTEATVGCMIHRYDPARDLRTSVPIGVPAANTALYVLDRRLRPVPEGSVGELYIAGQGLARGYLGRPDLTAERFPPDPFQPGRRMYRSGDRACFLPGGGLEYLGRGDHQIKLHGMRIEPGEIEARLKEHPAVTGAAVILRAEDPGGPRLVAYHTGPEPAPAPGLLRAWLAETLPRAMIPAALVRLARLPLTANGKLDRAALPAPPGQPEQQRQPARDEREALACAVWAEVLGQAEVGVFDNFFELGGDSIKAVQIAARLSARGWRSRAGDILRRQTVAELAGCLDAAAASPAQTPAMSASDAWGEPPMADWFFAGRPAVPGHYHQSVLLEARRPLDPARLAAALAALAEHHPGLRLNLDPDQRRLFVNPARRGSDFVPALIIVAPDDDLAALLAGRKAGWDLARDLLFRAMLVETPGRPQRLLLTAHHLLVDLVTWGILLEDLATAYVALEQARPVALPAPGPPPAAWRAALLRLYQSPAGLAELDHWRRIADLDFGLPREVEPTSWTMAATTSVIHELDPTASAKLAGWRAGPQEPGPADLVLAALAGALAAWTGNPRVVIETEGHGRHAEAMTGAPDLGRSLGWFTAMHPLALRLDGPDPAAWPGQVRQQAAATPNGGLGYLVLRNLLGKPELASGPTRPAVRFNYLGAVDGLLGNELLAYAPADTGLDNAPANPLTCELEVMAMLVAGRLRLRLTHHRQAQSPETITRLAADICVHLRTMLAAKPATAPRTEEFAGAGLTAADLEVLF